MRKHQGALAILLGTASSWPGRGHAQVHWDVGAQGGFSDRVPAGGAASRQVGPVAEVHGHIAVYPMLRVGPYASFEESPIGKDDRQVYAAGVRFKVTPPWLDPPWHAWAFAGLGYGYARIPALPASASTVELPAGVGVSDKISGPWQIYAELALRFDFAGLSWHGPGASTPSSPAGGDLLAVLLSVGVSFSP